MLLWLSVYVTHLGEDTAKSLAEKKMEGVMIGRTTPPRQDKNPATPPLDARKTR